MKVLITYATRFGSTAGIADRIMTIFENLGESVVTMPVDEVNAIDGFDAVIAGSAVRDEKWLPEAVEFISGQREALSLLPLALFTVCMTPVSSGTDYAADRVREWIKPVRSMVTPVSEGVFAGSFSLEKVNRPGERSKRNLNLLFSNWKEGDHRDWNEIESWAINLHDILSENYQSATE